MGKKKKTHKMTLVFFDVFVDYMRRSHLSARSSEDLSEKERHAIDTYQQIILMNLSVMESLLFDQDVIAKKADYRDFDSDLNKEIMRKACIQSGKETIEKHLEIEYEKEK